MKVQKLESSVTMLFIFTALITLGGSSCAHEGAFPFLSEPSTAEVAEPNSTCSAMQEDAQVELADSCGSINKEKKPAPITEALREPIDPSAYAH